MTLELLTPPTGRQGPGLVPRPAVDRLGLTLARRAAGLLAGDVRAAGAGEGTELEQLRPFQPGDDVRWLDASASARTGVPHVRRHVPERTLTTWIVLDVSPSMAWGTAQRLKSDVATGVTEVVSHLAVQHAGKVGLVLCGGDDPAVIPPRGGGAAHLAVTRAVAGGVVPDGAGRADALADALRRVGLLARRPGLICVISDLPAGEAIKRPLADLAARHSVLAVEVRDPRELELPPVGRLAVVDPESGERAEVELDAAARERFAARMRAERAEVARTLRALRAVHVVVTTDAPWLDALSARLGPREMRRRS